jgi:UDP-glucose 4-epimerase
MQKVLISGSAGFIGGYVVEELLAKGYAVVGVDNFSKYGKVAKSYDDNPDYQLVEGDCRDVGLMTDLLKDCDHFIAGAAMSASSRRPATRRSRRTSPGASRR